MSFVAGVARNMSYHAFSNLPCNNWQHVQFLLIYLTMTLSEPESRLSSFIDSGREILHTRHM